MARELHYKRWWLLFLNWNDWHLGQLAINIIWGHCIALIFSFDPQTIWTGRQYHYPYCSCHYSFDFLKLNLKCNTVWPWTGNLPPLTLECEDQISTPLASARFTVRHLDLNVSTKQWHSSVSQCLPHKPDNPSSIPWAHKRLGEAAHICNPSTSMTRWVGDTLWTW